MTFNFKQIDRSGETRAPMAEPPCPPVSGDQSIDTGVVMRAAAAEVRRHGRFRLSRQDMEDIVQDALLRLYSRDAQKGAIGNIAAFLRSTVRNLVFDRYRAPCVLEFVAEEDLRAVPDEAASPERIAIGREAWQAIASELARTPPRTLEMFLQYRFGDATYRELAEQYRLPRSTVHTQLSQVLERLARAVQPYLDV